MLGSAKKNFLHCVYLEHKSTNLCFYTETLVSQMTHLIKTS